MGFSTRAFDLFYKRLGLTGSNPSPVNNWDGYLESDWYNKYYLNGPPFSRSNISGSFLNFPDHSASVLSFDYTTTRDTSANEGYRALPWGSQACDMLWNCTVPSWSFQDVNRAVTITPPPDTVVTRTWNVNLKASGSFHKVNRGSSFGVSSYPITSSWNMFDGRFSNTQFSYITEIRDQSASPVTQSAYPTYVGSSWFTGTDQSLNYSYDITYPNLTANSTSSIDGQYFDAGQGVGITRAAISRSFVTQSIYSSDNTSTGLRKMTEALKARRLFFPIPVSGSGTSGGTDYWFKQFTGYTANNLFNENGGIYNVQFSLKRYVVADYYPDNGTYMNVFIHNVIPQIPSSSARINGADGWYPPSSNIVTIGNNYGGGPALSFYDIQTGYQIEKFNFNVVQYGYPAQLCIEAQGDTNNNAYFGIILNDLQICKVGVTTDPKFIKPTTIAQTTANNPFNPNNPTRPGTNPLPAPPTPPNN